MHPQKLHNLLSLLNFYHICFNIISCTYYQTPHPLYFCLALPLSTNAHPCTCSTATSAKKPRCRCHRGTGPVSWRPHVVCSVGAAACWPPAGALTTVVASPHSDPLGWGWALPRAPPPRRRAVPSMLCAQVPVPATSCIPAGLSPRCLCAPPWAALRPCGCATES